jgi:hypothetical protein
MSKRKEQEAQDVAMYLPSNTRRIHADGRDIWIFRKNTELQVVFEIAIYYDPDERGYCAQLVSPEIENDWKDVHVGHLFQDGIICMGYNPPSMRARYTLKEAYAKACLWAEGMAIMIMSHRNHTPCEFPFSDNNSSDEAFDARR